MSSRVFFALVAANSITMPSESASSHSYDVSHLLDEFRDTMPDELPPFRDIQHDIDLVPDPSC